MITEKIKAAMKKQHVTDTQIAKDLSINRTSFNLFKNNKGKLNSERVDKILTYLKLEINDKDI